MVTPRPTSSSIAIESIASHAINTGARAVKLFRNGANQAVRIPKEFELPGTQALIHREGNRLILELVPDRPKKGTLAALVFALDEIAKLGPCTDEFPDIGDEGLLPLDDINFGDDAP
jgi:antitoxin VapB